MAEVLALPVANPVAEDDALIARAIEILDRRLRSRRKGPDVSRMKDAKDFARLTLAAEPAERFMAFFMDSQHRVLDTEVLFRGSVDGCSIDPREVVRAGLRHNAAAVVFAHNHPSGITVASAADRIITERLQKVLALVDIRVLDHFVVGEGEATSFAEKGWV